MHIEIYTIKRSVDAVGLFCIAAMVGIGCAKSPNHERTIADLKREVARLKAERANLDARSTALDDKVLVLEKKLQKCDQAGSSKLTVVKLTPDDEATAWEERPISEAPKKWSDSDRQRPRLVLTNGSRRPRSAPAAPRSNRAPVTAGQFGHLGPDNLGVTSGAPTETGQSPENQAMEAFNTAYRAYSNKQHNVALQGFAGFVNGHPNHAYADNAIFWRGECYLAMGKLANAIGEFQRLKRRYPRSEKVAASVYKVGVIYDKMRDFGKAADYYFEVVERYPGTDEARRASRRVAEIRNQNGNVSGLLPTSATR